MEFGAVIVNPHVPEQVDGDLNPLYATIYVGNNKSIDYRGIKHEWIDDVTTWEQIGKIDLRQLIQDIVL